MLKPSLYIAENNEGIFHQYRVVLDVKETEKSYIFNLVEFNSCYSAAHIEMLFKNSKRIVIKKDKGGHAMRVWSDEDFTIYPFQAGTPYWFKKAQEVT